MKKINKVWLGVLLCFGFVFATTFLYQWYISQATVSGIVAIDVDEAITKIQDKDDFIMLVTRKECPYCEALLQVLNDTIDAHEDVLIYNVVMRDDTIENLQNDIDKLQTYVPKPDQTPHYYYVYRGEVVEDEMGFSPYNPMRFWQWLEMIDFID